MTESGVRCSGGVRTAENILDDEDIVATTALTEYVSKLEKILLRRNAEPNSTAQVAGNLVQTAPAFALCTAAAMNAIPSTPSSTFGKSRSCGGG
jgi:hypothetical protein